MQLSSNLREKTKSSNSEGFNSESVKRNSLIFGVIMIFLQLSFSFLYGFLINVQSIQFNAASTVITIGIAILVVPGFGLVFGYTRRLVWSGIGFTFFITAFCIQAYPLINDFWTKVGLQSNVPLNFDVGNRMFNLFLTDRQTALQGRNTYYGNSIINALKCALSVSVAWSALLGRAGQLQCLITTIFGVIGFQLNRQLIQQNQGRDTFGTFFIFTFGGFMGLGLGILSTFRERKTTSKLSVTSMRKYTGSEYSAVYSLFGCLIVFALFPLLSYGFDSYIRYNSYSPYLNPLCVIAAMGAGAVSSIIVSLLINGSIIVRDATHGLIAGAIAVGASSLYITNPVYAFVAGAVGGIIQSLIQTFIEQRAAKSKQIISTVSWSLFGIQGLVGAAFASGWKAISFGMTNDLTPQAKIFSQSSQFQFYGGLVSAGLGLAFGLGAGVLVILVNIQKQKEYFEDGYYWFANDGIRYSKAVEQIPPVKKIPVPDTTQEPIAPVPPPEPQRSEQLIQNLTADIDNFDFSETSENVINPYAYL